MSGMGVTGMQAPIFLILNSTILYIYKVISSCVQSDRKFKLHVCRKIYTSDGRAKVLKKLNETV